MGRDEDDATGGKADGNTSTDADTISTTTDATETANSQTLSPPPPPLPPRRKTSADLTQPRSRPTTAVSSIDIQTLSFPDGSRGTFSTVPGARSVSSPPMGALASGYTTPHSMRGSDTMSIMSGLAPTLRPTGDLASLVAGELNRKSRAWQLLQAQSASVQPFSGAASKKRRADGRFEGFAHEFDEIPDGNGSGSADNKGSKLADGDEARLALWKAKMKHYMILSSAGKPIYSRHGDLSLVNSYMGVVQTIISFYEGAKNPLLGFTAGDARFVVATEGPLYLIAISRLGESDAQLRDQLEALYMQILSTLTLPTLKNIFAHRPSTDLRKPLEGTESLLSSLADSFTRGSPSAMLGALECLRLRKSQRATITSAFLRARSERLLYGLIVAGGKLVSVIRPRKHSLHPSDLQLIFNMLFETESIRAGGGENWIPLCLPAFNNRGYLYMYVSFFSDGHAAGTQSSSNGSNTRKSPSPETQDGSDSSHQRTQSSASSSTKVTPEESPPDDEHRDEIAIILISPDKESFFELQEMRDKVAQQLTRNGSLAIISAAARAGRPQVGVVAPGAQITHFLYKSRANVQFCMSSLSSLYDSGRTRSGTKDESHDDGSPHAEDGNDNTTSTATKDDRLVARRRLMTLYHELHAAVHAKHSHLRVLHTVCEDAAGLGWVTPVFEFYCVAGPNVSRAVMTQGANKVIQWAKREEERLFIIGGGVF